MIYIYVILWTGAKLQLFGSSKNGFGFRQSDLDICMVMEGQATSEVSCVCVSVCMWTCEFLVSLVAVVVVVVVVTNIWNWLQLWFIQHFPVKSEINLINPLLYIFQGLDCIGIIESLARLLKKHQGYTLLYLFQCFPLHCLLYRICFENVKLSYYMAWLNASIWLVNRGNQWRVISAKQTAPLNNRPMPNQRLRPPGCTLWMCRIQH